MGVLLRSAAGAGVDLVLCTSGCADVWGPKALRAGMGAQAKIPIRAELAWSDTHEVVTNCGASLLVAASDGALHYSDVNWAEPVALLVGSEGDGPSAEALSCATGKVSVPLQNGVESLNAAVAGSILMFEASRQRFSHDKCKT